MAGEIKFTLSNLSLSPRMQAFAGAEACAEYADAVGADGYEVTPTTITRFGKTALTRDLMSKARAIEDWAADNHALSAVEGIPPEDVPENLAVYSNLIHSLHAAPRFRHQGNGLDLLRRTVYPPYEDSVYSARRIQRTIGRRVNAVMFPGYNLHSEVFHGSLGRAFNARLIKPRTIGALCGRHKIKDPDPITLRQLVTAEDADGVVWDTFDAMVQSDDPNGVRATARFWQLDAAGLIQAMHLAVGRIDYAPENSPLARHTVASKEAFIESPEAAANTVEGKLLAETAQIWQRTDDNESRIITLQTYPGFRTSTKQTMAEHKAIIAHARELVAAA